MVPRDIFTLEKRASTIPQDISPLETRCGRIVRPMTPGTTKQPDAPHDFLSLCSLRLLSFFFNRKEKTNDRFSPGKIR
jgi:hypothetical protein